MYHLDNFSRPDLSLALVHLGICRISELNPRAYKIGYHRKPNFAQTELRTNRTDRIQAVLWYF